MKSSQAPWNRNRRPWSIQRRPTLTVVICRSQCKKRWTPTLRPITNWRNAPCLRLLFLRSGDRGRGRGRGPGDWQDLKGKFEVPQSPFPQIGGDSSKYALACCRWHPPFFSISPIIPLSAVAYASGTRYVALLSWYITVNPTADIGRPAERPYALKQCRKLLLRRPKDGHAQIDRGNRDL